MKILDMLPHLDADALATVHINATRLVSGGSKKQQEQALTALPLIEAEQARRAELGPVKKVAKPKVAKTETKKKAVKGVSKRDMSEVHDDDD